MEVLTGDRNMPDPAAAAEGEEFPAHITPLFAEPHQQLVFDNPTAAAMSPQKLRIRCNGRSALPDDADPALLDKGLSPRNVVDEAHGGEFVNWKRKRKRTSSCASSRRKSRRLEKLEHFLESLVNKMLEKQEQMHMKLIEMVQDKEKERIAKEEAWKQQELERITRGEEVRAQETSRSLAIINFVQNLLGSDVQLPQPAPIVAQPVAAVPSSSHHDHQCVEENDKLHKDCHVQVPQPAPLVAQSVATVPPTSNHDHQCAEQNDNLHKDMATVKCSATATDKRWIQAEAQALIGLWASVEHKFQTPSNSGPGALWEEIALGMNSMGFDRTGKKCKEKWENMNKYFKKAITNDRKRSANDKTCQYFNELELLYKSGLLNLGNVGFSPPSNLENGGFSPTSNLGNGSCSPTSNMGNVGFSPPSNLENGGFSPTSNLGNGSCSPTSNLGNGGFSPTNNQKSENESQQCVPRDTSLLTDR
ncbi:hypothetical protein ACLB2K_027595 [Fragaria x ananassa]